MTVQLSDHMTWNGKSYTLTSRQPAPLFHPESIGITPRSFGSLCWCGFTASYEIKDKQLYVSSLRIGLDPKNFKSPPTINGVAPHKFNGGTYLGHYYEDIWLPVTYSGKLLLGHQWVGNLGRGHHGYASTVEFEEVQSCVFEKGFLVSATDVSEQHAAEQAKLIAEENKRVEAQLVIEARQQRRRNLINKVKLFFTRKKPTTADDDDCFL